MSAKVLLVDDEEEFTNILSERMQTRGFRVDIAGSGYKAIEKVKGESFDAIVLDLAMPDMDGIETLKQLLKLNPDMQIIFLTGHATLQKGIEAVKLGAQEFMEKPVDINNLIEKIKVAKENKILLEEKRSEEKVKNILKRKGW